MTARGRWFTRLEFGHVDKLYMHKVENETHELRYIKMRHMKMRHMKWDLWNETHENEINENETHEMRHMKWDPWNETYEMRHMKMR